VSEPSITETTVSVAPIEHPAPKPSRPIRRPWLRPALAAVALALAGLGAAQIGFGSLPLAIRYARGERLIVEPARLHVAGLTVADQTLVATEVYNYTKVPVRLLGSAASCTCVTVKDLPPSIPAGGKARLSLLVHALADKPGVDQPIILFTDDPGRPQLGVRVTGTAREVSPPPRLR